VAESFTICSSRTSQSIRKLFDTPSYDVQVTYSYKGSDIKGVKCMPGM